MLNRRNRISAADCLAWSLRIQNALIGQPYFVRARSLGLYSPIRNEVLTEYLFSAGRGHGKKVAYPRIRGETLEFATITDLRQLVPGSFGIPEPAGGEVIPASGLDLVVVPGLGFDLSGYRLGYGKGFYDRVFHCPAGTVLVGLAFESQVVDALPAEIHDIRMDVVVTEQRVLGFNRLSPHVNQQYFHGGTER